MEKGSRHRGGAESTDMVWRQELETVGRDRRSRQGVEMGWRQGMQTGVETGGGDNRW